MRFLVLLILSGLSAFFLGVYLPYWGLMLLVAVLAALIAENGTTAFFAPAFAVGMVWLLLPLSIIYRTDSDLPAELAVIMGLDPAVLFLATALTGFLSAGLGALTGYQFRKMLRRPLRYK